MILYIFLLISVTISEKSSEKEILTTASTYCTELLQHIPIVLVTLGAQGLILGYREEVGNKLIVEVQAVL